MPEHSPGNILAPNTADDTAVLVSLDFNDSNVTDPAENLEELRQLAASDCLAVSAVIKGKRSKPDPATFAGSGKVEEISLALEKTGASLVIFNHDLSPAQQRN